MKPNILLYFIIFPIYLSAQAVPPEKVVYKGEEYWRYEDQDSTMENVTPYLTSWKGRPAFPRDGKWISFYGQDTSRVAHFFHVKDSLVHGPMVIFDFQGKKRVSFEFYKGQSHGKIQYWNHKGILIYQAQRHYQKGQCCGIGITVGVEKSWDDEGNIIAEHHFNNQGQRHGPAFPTTQMAIKN